MRLFVGLIGTLMVAAGCVSDQEAGSRLGERHARELKAHTITLERLDAELQAAEVQRETASAREAFISGYRQGIEPAKPELARLYVETAAGGLGDVARTIENSVDVFVRGVVDSVEDAPAPAPSEPSGRWKHMRQVGRHLGRIVNGLGEAVRAAAGGFMEEVGND